MFQRNRDLPFSVRPACVGPFCSLSASLLRLQTDPKNSQRPVPVPVLAGCFGNSCRPCDPVLRAHWRFIFLNILRCKHAIVPDVLMETSWKDEPFRSDHNNTLSVSSCILTVSVTNTTCHRCVDNTFIFCLPIAE